MHFNSPRIVLLVLMVATGLASCSNVPENNDPVIGIWARTEAPEGSSHQTTLREEWIFNDVYLGRYHRYEDQNITIQTDFTWSLIKNVYTIEYPGLDRAPEQVTMHRNSDGITLETLAGEVLAERE